MLKISIASDHAGLELKSCIISALTEWGFAYIDFEYNNSGIYEYPDYALLVAKSITANETKYGILICGSGIGMSIASNRHINVRASLCYNEETARLAREHNNANVICLGARLIDKNIAIKAVQIFLNTEFLGGRHKQRVSKLSKITDITTDN